ncbi:serine hydrolase domain-containing protein [Rhodohalobacter mucosus]|uniref:Serine hydrolase n=1 Tax=Rhodohalobacter mucosus TaxID=2079485 RepID=A0A316TU41_9BACT|nr:serine hydrolase domain-containing protein [Rhodohalobacter mucosus]PWN06535.1 serine hydrolase [Rhodohalobacter mucosus]
MSFTKPTVLETEIERFFRKTAKKDARVKNAFLLVHSEKANLHINLAEGTTGDIPSTPQQPNYMASVGKLFTSTIIALLHERGELSFEDKISRYLEPDIMDGLHVYKGDNWSDQIQIRHLLNQSSGLPDNFFPLLDKLLADPDFSITPREAVIWARRNLNPSAPPGKKGFYTDTNYHLLGLIVEHITGRPFHEALREMIFAPLGMKHASMLHVSEPMEETDLPIADFFTDDIRLNELKGFAGIDYAGGGVVAPMDDLLTFMKALSSHKLVSAETLGIMKKDKVGLNPGFDYGYGIWQVKPIPVILPEKYSCWGVLGATGAFMFYHPQLDAYLIGNFNHTSYQKKCVRFMFKVIRQILKHQQ